MRDTGYDRRLEPYFGRLGIWAFSIGTSIGWGSFVVLLRGSDYEVRGELMAEMDRIAEENKRNSGVVIASGIAEFEPGEHRSVLRVFEIADQKMYARKKELKG